MSTLAYAPAPVERPRARPEREQPLRRVEIVSTRGQRRRRPRPIYAVVTIGGLFALFIAQLLMSIAISEGAYQISSLQGEQAKLQRTEVNLSEQVDTLASTQNLAAQATDLGMVLGSTTPAFLDVATGTVIGKTKDLPVASSTFGTGLVSNALLPGEVEGGVTTDGAAGTETATDTVTTEAVTTGTTGAIDPTLTDPTETLDGGIGTGTGTTTTTGAPTGSPTGGSVTSQSGLPVPVTR